MVETWPAARLMMEPGMKKGETFARAAGEEVGVLALDVSPKLPMPEPMVWTPTRSERRSRRR